MAMYINDYRPWPDWVVAGNEEIAREFGAQIGTYRGHADRDPGHDMSGDLAADFFLYTNTKAKHDQVLAWFKRNARRIGATYIITWRRIWSVERATEGNRDYAGSDPHTEHIHVSYGTKPPQTRPVPPVQPSLGVPIMADAKPISIVDYKGEQRLDPDGGYVHINAEKNTSVVSGESKGIDVTAGVVVEGLGEGERVRLWWRVEWKKDGQPSQAKRGKPHVTVAHDPADASPGVQVRYADDLPKAASGWTACLRLMYSTTSKTAKITRIYFDGWEL